MGLPAGWSRPRLQQTGPGQHRAWWQCPQLVQSLPRLHPGAHSQLFSQEAACFVLAVLISHVKTLKVSQDVTDLAGLHACC